MALATFGGHRAFRNWPLVDIRLPYSCMAFDPAHCITFCSGVLPTVMTPEHFQQFDLWLTPDDPCVTFGPSNVLHFCQGFFLPNLVPVGHSQADSLWMTFDFSWECFKKLITTSGPHCLPSYQVSAWCDEALRNADRQTKLFFSIYVTTKSMINLVWSMNCSLTSNTKVVKLNQIFHFPEMIYNKRLMQW